MNDAVKLAQEQVRHCDSGHEEVRESVARHGVTLPPSDPHTACPREFCILARALLKEREKLERFAALVNQTWDEATGSAADYDSGRRAVCRDMTKALAAESPPALKSTDPIAEGENG